MPLRNIGLVCLLIILVATIFSVQPAYACSPMPTPEGPTPTAVTLESRVQNIPVIFEGTVTAISEDRSLTTMQVARYFKGSGPGTVTVLGFGWGSDCLPVTYVGEHAIFYTFGNPAEELSISSWSSIEAVDDAQVDAIIKAVGREPVLVSNDSVLVFTDLVKIIVAAIIGLGIIIVIIAAIIWLKRKPKEA